MSAAKFGNPPFFGGVDAGGTNFHCLVARSPGEILAETAIPTRDPQSTLAGVAGFFRRQLAQGCALGGIGVACFGPVDVSANSPSRGRILKTPKVGWSNVNVAAALETLGLPVWMETDVNAAALAEGEWGAAQGARDFAYVTVGTGIGVGVVVSGAPVHGVLHPEGGHLRAPRHPEDDFPGVCPFHGDCIEGMASAPALRARFGADPAALPNDHPAWEMEAHYLGHLADALLMLLAPSRIVFGGGVMLRAGLVERVRAVLSQLAGGYDSALSRCGGSGGLIAPAALSERAGALGAILGAARSLSACAAG